MVRYNKRWHLKSVICICICLVYIFPILFQNKSVIANAQNNPKSQEQKYASVTLNNSIKLFNTNISKKGKCKISIKNNTSQVSIKSFSKNIFDGKYNNGYISLNSKESLIDTHLKIYKTTKWMQVKPSQIFTISGKGTNRAIWQFKNADGTKYIVKNAKTIQVPNNMAFARVYYSKSIDGDVQIESGSSATKFEAHVESTIIIPASKDKETLYQDEKNIWHKTNVRSEIKNIGVLQCYDNITSFVVYGEDIGNLSINYIKKTTIDDDSYGVRWSLTELTENCDRLDGSTSLIASAIEGNSPIANDFDYVYPWSDIRLCNIDSMDKITYRGEKGFSYDGSNGNVFVELPKWYVKRYQDATHEYLYISKVPKEGYEIEPSFIEGTQILDKIYIGAYDGYVSNEKKLVSWSGTYPTTNLPLSTFRNYARANGSFRYGVIDIRTIIALQHLYLVEFANKNSSKTIGMGLQKMQYPFTKPAAFSEKEANRIILTNVRADEFKVGQSCAVSEKESYIMEHRIITSITKYDSSYKALYFSGKPYDINKSSTYIYNTPLANGMCDQMSAPSGYASGYIIGNGFTSVRYRFIENPWGNIWNCIDGIIVDKKVPAVCYDMTKYVSGGSKDYIPLNYRLPEQMENGNTDTYVNQIIKNLGYDPKFPALGFPSEISAGANKDNSFGDSFYCGDAFIREVRWKGAWDLGIGVADRAGLFMLRAWFGVDEPYWHDGARLMYKPINLTKNN